MEGKIGGKYTGYRMAGAGSFLPYNRLDARLQRLQSFGILYRYWLLVADLKLYTG